MSLTIREIISDAKRLANRLQDRDSATDSLINETHAIKTKIQAMKMFQREVEELNQVAHQKPHSQLIADIQNENRHLREIQQENRELKSTLEDYQNTIEFIMTKYRKHSEEHIYQSKINFKAMQDQRYQYIIQEQANKIQEMAAIMQKAVVLDDKDLKFEEVVSRLNAENQGLRQLLQISKNLNVNTNDKTVQTDVVS